MALLNEYRRQFAWRDWDRALALCHVAPGVRVLDLGCGPGDLAATFARCGALVTGVDGNEELLAAARTNCPKAIFEKQDLKSLSLPLASYDGLWCSFTAAYFCDFEKTLQHWLTFLKPKAWVALIEADDLLGHEPLSGEARKHIEGFYSEAHAASRYDFRAGRKLNGALERSGFQVQEIMLNDQELSFAGPAAPAVLQAWTDRLGRMGGLAAFLQDQYGPFREEFLRALSAKNHRSHCRVVCCVGTRP